MDPVGIYAFVVILHSAKIDACQHFMLAKTGTGKFYLGRSSPVRH